MAAGNTAGTCGKAIAEVPPEDGPIHPQLAVASWIAVVLLHDGLG
jgi:hypothetical protein